MLSIAKRNTVTVGSQTWEYHGDDSDSTVFYVTPMPMFATLDNGLPAVQIVEYQNDQPTNGSGYCQIQVELGIPQDSADAVLAAIKSDIAQKYGTSNPELQTLAVKSGTVVTLSYPTDPSNPNAPGQIQVPGSDFGSNLAIFEVPLSANQMKIVKAQMAGTGQGPFSVSYSLVVPSITPGVEVHLSFDSNIAYNYEVTVVRHVHETEWSESVSYTYDIEKYLAESDASSVSITKSDPNLPDSVIDDLRTWCMTVISERVQQSVADAQALLDQGGGTQSFSINQVSSFQESYYQSESMNWRISPQASLPTFATLNVSVSDQAKLEPVINTQGFTVTVAPKVSFVGSNTNKSKKQGNLPAASTDPFNSSIRSLTRLDVTIVYSTLPGGTQTLTFTSDTPQTWTADLDPTKQNVYDLQYTAVYSSPNPATPSQTFSWEIKGLDATVYDLTLENIGTLYVNFDATGLFAEPKYGAGIARVDINFVFNIPNAVPYVQPFSLSKNSTNTASGTNSAQYTVFSISSAPIETTYSYTMTYYFNDTIKANPFTTDVKQSNARDVSIVAPDLMLPMNFLVNMGEPTTAGSGFIDFSANIFYDGTPYMPPAMTGSIFPTSPISIEYPLTSTSSTPSAPSTFPSNTALPSSSGASGIVKCQTFLFANSKQTPFTISATGTTPDGTQVNWGPYNFSIEAVNSMSFFPANQFAFIEIDPSIVDWKITSDSGTTPSTCGLLHVSVNIVNIYYLDSTGAQQTIPANIGLTHTTQYNSQQNKAPYLYYQVSNLKAQDWSNLEYDWVAQYVYTTGVMYASNAGTGTQPTVRQSGNLVLPVSATLAIDPTSGLLPKPKTATGSNAVMSNAQAKANVRHTETEPA